MISSVEYMMCCTGFEWNKHRCTYVHWRIYSNRDLDTLLYKVEVIWNGNHRSLYTNTTVDMIRLSDVFTRKKWQLLLAGIVKAQRFDTWDGHSRVLNVLHTYELCDVSTGEFIDTLSLSHSLLAGETVNCCQHIEDLKAIGNSRYCNK